VRIGNQQAASLRYGGSIKMPWWVFGQPISHLAWPQRRQSFSSGSIRSVTGSNTRTAA
jgi:hypothetical protein